MIRSEELETAWPSLIQPWMGTGTTSASKVSAPEDADPATIVFASQPDQLAKALARRAGLIVASASLSAPPVLPSGTRLFKSMNVGLAMATILPRFDRKHERFKQELKIHPQSFIHPTARLGADVVVGPFATIGADAHVDEGAIIGASTVVERGARIGARTILHPCVFFGADCEIGVDGEIHPHATIGADGFGFARDQQGRSHKLPQLGRVILGDRVEIGANTAVDRAAFAETRIGSGVKLDNMIHIGHNCEIGDDGVFAGGFLMAGSSRTGKRFLGGAASAVTDHVSITDDVMLAGRSTVTNDVTKPGAYGGYPLVPLKDHLRNIATFAKLTDIRKQVSRIMKHLGLSEEQ